MPTIRSPISPPLRLLRLTIGRRSQPRQKPIRQLGSVIAAQRSIRDDSILSDEQGQGQGIGCRVIGPLPNLGHVSSEQYANSFEDWVLCHGGDRSSNFLPRHTASPIRIVNVYIDDRDTCFAKPGSKCRQCCQNVMTWGAPVGAEHKDDGACLARQRRELAWNSHVVGQAESIPTHVEVNQIRRNDGLVLGQNRPRVCKRREGQQQRG